jgi:hypothetical protein
VCTLTPLQCHFCSSALVRVTQPGVDDRLVCPICWAQADYQAVARDGAALQRGVRIERALRILVDKARFPRRATPPAGAPPANGDAPTPQAATGKDKPDPA